MNAPISRRTFLGGAAALGLTSSQSALGLPSFLTQPDESKTGKLVVIYLRGAADFLNMLVPRDDDDYAAARPTLRLGPEDGLINLNPDWALHPSLAKLKPLWDSGSLAPIVCVGSPHTTRSHFDAQDFMEYAAPGDRTQRQGWLNRYLAATTQGQPDIFRSVAMQGLLPRSLRGDFPVLAMPSQFGGARDRDGARTLDAFEKFYGEGGMNPRPSDGEEILNSGTVTIETLRKFRAILGEAEEDVPGYPKGRFGSALERTATIFQANAGLQVAGVDYSGWDHHTGQGSTEGRHATMLEDLSGSVAAFCKQLGKDMDTTSILIMTEFGRTVSENGNNGTDHGHGAGMFLIGGGVKGGEVHGDWSGLQRKSLYQGRDLPVTTDFRDVFAEVLQERLGFELPRDFFLGHRPKKLKMF